MRPRKQGEKNGRSLEWIVTLSSPEPEKKGGQEASESRKAGVPIKM